MRTSCSKRINRLNQPPETQQSKHCVAPCCPQTPTTCQRKHYLLYKYILYIYICICIPIDVFWSLLIHIQLLTTLDKRLHPTPPIPSLLRLIARGLSHRGELRTHGDGQSGALTRPSGNVGLFLPGRCRSRQRRTVSSRARLSSFG